MTLDFGVLSGSLIKFINSEEVRITRGQMLGAMKTDVGSFQAVHLQYQIGKFK